MHPTISLKRKRVVLLPKEQMKDICSNPRKRPAHKCRTYPEISGLCSYLITQKQTSLPTSILLRLNLTSSRGTPTTSFTSPRFFRARMFTVLLLVLFSVDIILLLVYLLTN